MISLSNYRYRGERETAFRLHTSDFLASGTCVYLIRPPPIRRILHNAAHLADLPVVENKYTKQNK